MHVALMFKKAAKSCASAGEPNRLAQKSVQVIRQDGSYVFLYKEF